MDKLKCRGAVINQHKQPAYGNKILRLPPPPQLIVPLYNFESGAMLPTARVGETVAKHAVLAHSKNKASVVIAPASGRLVAIERINHPIMGSVLAAFMRTDSRIPPVPPVPHNLSAMTAEGILKAVRIANIIDETDGMPVYHKLLRAVEEKVLLLIADCIDDTPYISSALKTVQDHGDLCADGVSVVLKLLGGGKATLAFFNSGGIDTEELLFKIGFMNTVELTGGYPAWFSFKRHYANEKHIRLGVQALRSISLAVRDGIPQTEFMVTVGGDCVSTPTNVIASTGTTVGNLLHKVGLSSTPRYIVLGDTMTGAAVTSLDTPVFPGIRGVTAMSGVQKVPTTACIGCGACSAVCPHMLFPSEANRMYEQGMTALAASYGANRCVGCGACSAVCPSGIELSEIMLLLLEGERARTAD
ncbi:MAG: 4Fe-4S dicluster domain-containing protein [Oscillospiraceae bacterium]|jgi:electron transport complex protein RnfC|nr:4Fe-4S dicluster domain-containing protein [Oscillospiraceae bacterium]